MYGPGWISDANRQADPVAGVAYIHPAATAPTGDLRSLARGSTEESIWIADATSAVTGVQDSE